jgi:hypothetical protein
LPDGRHLIEERRLVGNRVEKTVRIAGQAPYVESVRLYRAEELAALVAANGWGWDTPWRSLTGSDRDGGRMVAWIGMP